jgi:hypothetical protein
MPKGNPSPNYTGIVGHPNRRRYYWEHEVYSCIGALAKGRKYEKPEMVPNPRALSKQRVLEIFSVTYPTYWAWERKGRVPQGFYFTQADGADADEAEADAAE